MTIEQIEKAAEEMMPYSKDGSSAGRSVFGKHYKRGFRAGAQWRINSVWHKKHTVIPEAGRPALLELKDPVSGKTVYKVDSYSGNEWIGITHYEYSGLIQFAYIDDLLSERKEEDV